MTKRMKLLLSLFLLGFAFSLAWGEDETWSKSNRGLRGRLIVLPSDKPESPFCRVFIELQNTEDAMGQKKIRFNPEKLDLQVTDKDGKPLKPDDGPYDGMQPLWEPILLPFAGTIKFQVSFPGLSYFSGKDKVIVDMGVRRSWIIPQTGDYFLAGTFSVARERSDSSMDWSGSIAFPPAKIPSAK